MKFQIEGQRTLQGTIQVSGAKNAALKFMAAALLSEEAWTIENVPAISDVRAMAELLVALGASVEQPDPATYVINASTVKTATLPDEQARKFRASLLCVMPLLARFGEAHFSYPGGCVLGKRPINLFLDGYRALGATVEERDDQFTVAAPRGLAGSRFVFPFVSHMATESLLLGATLAKGTTTIVNAAMEPEVAALADWLVQTGARIDGIGQHTMTVSGVSKLGGGRVRILPDRIEAGTFAILGSLLADELTITDCEPKHLDTFWEMLKRAGGDFTLKETSVTVHRAKELRATDLRTREYPGFPTDLQAPFTVLLTQAKGMSIVHEVIYEGRLFYTDRLNTMGAQIIMADPYRVIVEGPSPLVGKKLESPDIRAGIALVIAAMIAKGTSLIDNVSHIDRGYERIDERLRELGAAITRLE
jgi:UDP-N-acetylglucosamine 1-carboxyvinyltransferase